MRYRVVQISEVQENGMSLDPHDYLVKEVDMKDSGIRGGEFVPPLFRPDGKDLQEQAKQLLREASHEAGEGIEHADLYGDDAALAKFASIRNTIDTVREYMAGTRTLEHRQVRGGE